MRLIAIILLLLSSPALAQMSTTFDPNNPQLSGATLVFDDEFKTLSTVDVNNTKANGFKWYVQYPFGAPFSPSTDFSMTANGLLISPGVKEPGNWGISTAVVNSNSPTGYYGAAFNGALYIEASISFDDSTMVGLTTVWPSFWSIAREHILHNPTGGKSDQWQGQAAGYVHFIEDDFFEYDTFPGLGHNSYGSGAHDWYAAGTTSVQDNGLTSLGATTWTNPHRIGQLIVPGHGKITYFDGVATSVINTWIDKFPGVPPPVSPYVFNILDQDHLVLILGTATTTPMTVGYVRVWQLPNCN